jgi:hypothetical protein
MMGVEQVLEPKEAAPISQAALAALQVVAAE